MREIIFDTETTGMPASEGHRIIEIGAIEVIDRFPTGKTFHHYLNPQGFKVAPGAFEVHNISDEFLLDKPSFGDLIDEFESFFSDARLVAHNAAFDIGFLDAELKRLGKPATDPSVVVDTLAIARRHFPGARHSLDALCQRFGISNARRVYHGALLDAELLLDVYLELTGGRQAGLGFDGAGTNAHDARRSGAPTTRTQPQRPKPLPSRIKPQEKAAHDAMLEQLGESAVWKHHLT